MSTLSLSLVSHGKIMAERSYARYILRLIFPFLNLGRKSYQFIRANQVALINSLINLL